MKRLILSTVFIFCLGCASSGTYHSNWHYDDKAEMNRLDPDENISMVYVPIYLEMKMAAPDFVHIHNHSRNLLKTQSFSE